MDGAALVRPSIFPIFICFFVDHPLETVVDCFSAKKKEADVAAPMTQ